LTLIVHLAQLLASDANIIEYSATIEMTIGPIGCRAVSGLRVKGLSDVYADPGEDMAKKDDPTWKSYEQIAIMVLNQCANEFGLSRIDGKQDVAGKSGTQWEVDARGWAKGDTAHFLVECKKHENAAISQAITASLAYQIHDTDAKGGFLVSPNGLQSGAKLVAAANNIHEIKLDAKSSTAAYFGEWLGTLRVGFNEEVNLQVSEHLLIKVIDQNGNEKVIYNSDES
jgi:hypothetical protein